MNSLSPSAGKLSPTMQTVAELLRSNSGVIKRFPGGFWYVQNAAGKCIHPHHGTKTVEALVTRGLLEYSEFKTNRAGRFPIEARLVTNSPESNGQGTQLSEQAAQV